MSISESIKHIRDFAGDILGNTEFSLENPVSHEGISFVPIVLNEEKKIKPLLCILLSSIL